MDFVRAYKKMASLLLRGQYISPFDRVFWILWRKALVFCIGLGAYPVHEHFLLLQERGGRSYSGLPPEGRRMGMLLHSWGRYREMKSRGRGADLWMIESWCYAYQMRHGHFVQECVIEASIRKCRSAERNWNDLTQTKSLLTKVRSLLGWRQHATSYQRHRDSHSLLGLSS